jgi:hypothetical protein
MEPRSSYYYDGKVFRLRSKWNKRFRLFLMLVCFLGLSGYSKDISDGEVVPQKHALESHVLEENPKVSINDAKSIVNAVIKWGTEFSIDPKLLLAIAKVESNYNKHAISPSGAYGLMQVIPVWHKDKIKKAKEELGNPEVFDIHTNIYLGASVLRECYNKNPGLSKALLCYAGQTPGYDKKVLAAYRALKIFT